MREVECRALSVPICLNSDKIKKAFEENKRSKKFIASSDSYKCKSFTKDKEENKNRKLITLLKEIYQDKCAFCETSLLDRYPHIEHFRPKNRYYWLAYSWSNLLPVCEVCNINKSEKFDIENSIATYNKQKVHQLHFRLKTSNKIENQKLLHPEIDKFEHLIFFTNKGKIIASNEKVKYTVETCQLNRDEIKVKREKILNEFLNGLKDIYTHNGIDITYYRNIVKTFIQNSSSKEEFTLFKRFIIKRIDLFIKQYQVEFQKVIKLAIDKYQ